MGENLEDRGPEEESDPAALFIDAKGRIATLPPVPLIPPIEEQADRPLRERIAAGERYLANILRGGAYTGGTMFAASLVMRLLPLNQDASVARSMLEASGLAMLLVTPVARLVGSGVMLGARGEWRYTLYAAGVLSLLAMAVGAGFKA